MNTLLQLAKGDATQLYYITDTDTKLIEYVTLGAENKTIFDSLISSLTSEYGNKVINFPILNSDVLLNKNIDLFITVSDITLSDIVEEPIDYTSLSGDLQTKLTNFINMAESL